MLKKSYEFYVTKSSRSSKKVDEIHKWIVNQLLKIFPTTTHTVKDEVKIKSKNSSGFKMTDIGVKTNNNDIYIY